MNAYGLASAFGPQIAEYLAFKEKMGCYGSSRIWYLNRFDAYCAEHDRRVFDRDTVEGWVSEQLTRSGRYRSWMSYIRDFGRWLQAHGDAEAYVLSGRWKAPFVPAHPYLLTAHEIELFFDAAAGLQAQSPWQWQSVAFFALMHSCGLRTGEARALLTERVDLHGGHIDIVWSKGNRSRRLPLTGEVIEVLTACDQASRRRFATRRTFRLRRGEPGHGRNGRKGVQPHLGPSQAPQAGGRLSAVTRMLGRCPMGSVRIDIRFLHGSYGHGLESLGHVTTP